MSKWAEKYVIGLTGNIGTGKSIVRKMLEHLGAYGIDADAISHRVISKDSPGFRQVIDRFGEKVLDDKGQIDRRKLGEIVFSDPEALIHLENIVHPLVEHAIDSLVKRVAHKIIVIEAIKLIETHMTDYCDSLWVTFAPTETQQARLIEYRQMNENDARVRITAQSPQEQKLKKADVVINNVSTFEDTWRQVSAAWQKYIPEIINVPDIIQAKRFPNSDMNWNIIHAKPRHSLELTHFINRLHIYEKKYKQDDIMTAFGEKSFLILQIRQETMGVIGWQAENLIARTKDIYIDPSIPNDSAIPVMINEIEHASKLLLCEALFVVLPPKLAQLEEMWNNLGYQSHEINSLLVQPWEEAARETLSDGMMLYIKPFGNDWNFYLS